MSFSSDMKVELSRVLPEKKCCQRAEISGILRASGTIVLAGRGKVRIVIHTDHPAIARHYRKLLHEYYDISPEVSIGEPSALKKGHTYMLTITPEMMSESILRETGLLTVREGHDCLTDGIYDGNIRTKCCRRAYLRGMFLGIGTVSDPVKGYHLEFVCNSEVLAKDLRRLINTFDDLSARIVPRKDKFIVYMKNSQYISDTLAIMGAHSGVLKIEDVKIHKELVREAVRITNCDNANTDRALEASRKQADAIRKIKDTKGLDYLSDKLKELAVLRLYNPEVSLTQLGEMMSPPLKKSGVNNRMRRIMEIADKL